MGGTLPAWGRVPEAGSSNTHVCSSWSQQQQPLTLSVCVCVCVLTVVLVCCLDDTGCSQKQTERNTGADLHGEMILTFQGVRF